MGRTASDCGRDGRTDRSACTTVTVAVLRPAAPPPPAVSAGSPLLRRSGPSLDPLSPELHAERRRSAHSPRDPVRACIPLYHLAARNERWCGCPPALHFFTGLASHRHVGARVAEVPSTPTQPQPRRRPLQAADRWRPHATARPSLEGERLQSVRARSSGALCRHRRLAERVVRRPRCWR